MAAAGQVHETRATMRSKGSTEPGRWRWVGDAEEEAVIATRQLLLPYTLALREKEANDAEWLLLQQVRTEAGKAEKAPMYTRYTCIYMHIHHIIHHIYTYNTPLNTLKYALHTPYNNLLNRRTRLMCFPIVSIAARGG